MENLMEEAAQGVMKKDWEPVHDALCQALGEAVLASSNADERAKVAGTMEEKQMRANQERKMRDAACEIATIIKKGCG